MSAYHGWVFGIGTAVILLVVFYWMYRLHQSNQLREAEIAHFHQRFQVNYFRNSDDESGIPSLEALQNGVNYALPLDMVSYPHAHTHSHSQPHANLYPHAQCHAFLFPGLAHVQTSRDPRHLRRTREARQSQAVSWAGGNEDRLLSWRDRERFPSELNRETIRNTILTELGAFDSPDDVNNNNNNNNFLNDGPHGPFLPPHKLVLTPPPYEEESFSERAKMERSDAPPPPYQSLPRNREIKLMDRETTLPEETDENRLWIADRHSDTNHSTTTTTITTTTTTASPSTTSRLTQTVSISQTASPLQSSLSLSPSSLSPSPLSQSSFPDTSTNISSTSLTNHFTASQQSSTSASPETVLQLPSSPTHRSHPLSSLLYPNPPICPSLDFHLLSPVFLPSSSLRPSTPPCLSDLSHSPPPPPPSFLARLSDLPSSLPPPPPPPSSLPPPSPPPSNCLRQSSNMSSIGLPPPAYSQCGNNSPLTSEAYSLADTVTPPSPMEEPPKYEDIC